LPYPFPFQEAFLASEAYLAFQEDQEEIQEVLEVREASSYLEHLGEEAASSFLERLEEEAASSFLERLEEVVASSCRKHREVEEASSFQELPVVEVASSYLERLGEVVASSCRMILEAEEASSFPTLLAVEGVATSCLELLEEAVASSFPKVLVVEEVAYSSLEFLEEEVASSFLQVVREASLSKVDQVASEEVAGFLPWVEEEVEEVDFRNRQEEGVVGGSFHLDWGLEEAGAGKRHLEDLEGMAQHNLPLTMVDLVGQFQEDRVEDQVVEVDHSFRLLGVLVEVEDPWLPEDLVEVVDSYRREDLEVVVDSFHQGVLGVVVDSYRQEDLVEEASLKILEYDLGDLDLGGLAEEEELLAVLFVSLEALESDSTLGEETC
jgi:hypothetical protein